MRRATVEVCGKGPEAQKQRVTSAGERVLASFILARVVRLRAIAIAIAAVLSVCPSV